jgi:hypothetical protein
MVKAYRGVSDLIFSPGRPPQVESNGHLVPVKFEGLPVLTADHTSRIAHELIGQNKQAMQILKDSGACDFSYGLPQHSRFRVNVFQQRGSYAIVMRVIPPHVPTFDELKLPPQLARIAELRNGIVLVTGPTGSASLRRWRRSSTRSTLTAPSTSSPSRTPSSSCTATRKPPSISASCTAIRPASRSPCAPRCGRRPRSSWSVKCATARPSRSP